MDNEDAFDAVRGNPMLDNSAEDWDTLFWIRKWFKDAVEAQGADVPDSGCGFGEVDMTVKIDGKWFKAVLKPLAVGTRQ